MAGAGGESSHLLRRVEEFRQSNALLKRETEMFEHYITRMGLGDLGRDSVAQVGLGPVDQETAPRLRVEQKCIVARYETEKTRVDLVKLQKGHEKSMENLAVMLEEAEIHLGDLKRERRGFESFAARAPLQKNGEKAIRYCEEALKAKSSTVEKQRLRNAALKAQRRKLEMQQRQRETGEAPGLVDFQQLQTENRQYLESIDQCNQEMMHYKVQARNTLQTLNQLKKKLQSMTSKSQVLSSEMSTLTEKLKKTEEEMLRVEKERARVEALNRRIRQQREDFCVPDVMEYITTTVTYRELEQNLRARQRKVSLPKVGGRNPAEAGMGVRTLTHSRVTSAQPHSEERFLPRVHTKM